MPPSLPGSGSRPDQTLSLNMRLVAHHELQGFGGIGEGMALQLTRDGRRILWLAHESAPKNFTGVDVTDPRAPRVLVQTELPHAKVRSNSGNTVWVKPLNGGEFCQRPTSLGCALSAMSRITAPPSI